MSVMEDSFVSVMDVAPEADVRDGSRVRPIFRQIRTDCLSADEVDARWQRVDETMSAELRRTDDRLRVEWRASWRVGDESGRSAAKQRLLELAEHRRAQRDLYEQAMQSVGLLRDKHIELLEWAMNSSRNGWRLSEDADGGEALCKSFVIVLEDGEEVIPYRKKPRGKPYAAFFVSNNGNRRENALDVFTETELRRLVLGLGYRVYCRNREGTRTGLYTAQSPNRVRFLES